jgi:hypothetical protein
MLTNPFPLRGRIAGLNVKAVLPNPRSLPANAFGNQETRELVPWEGFPIVWQGIQVVK